jgi:uncharacterized protein YggE
MFVRSLYSALAFFVLAGATTAWSQQPMSMERVITVTGRAEVQVAPDIVEVQLGVEEQAPTAREAMEKTSRAMKAVLERLGRARVPNNQIRTATLRLEPVYESGRNPEQPELRLVGYRASNTVTVTLKEVARAGPVLDAALEGGANRLHGLHFRLADDLPPRLEALKAASGEAQKKARAIAESLGLSLGRVDSVAESAEVTPLPRYEAMTMAARAPGVPVQPGEITVRADVTLRYRISDAP